MISFLDPGHAAVAVIDVQENHYPHVRDGHAVLDRICRTVDLATTMEVPLLWTEHYPGGFGRTLEPLAVRLNETHTPITKRAFGCFLVPEFVEELRRTGRSDLYLVGTETPICILQTALGALQAGLRTVVVVDCVTGRHKLDHKLALRRMAAAGVVLVTWEMLAYEWLRTSEHPKFKRILPLVKGASGHQQVGGGANPTRWGGRAPNGGRSGSEI